MEQKYKYKEIYNPDSNRLKSYDYGSQGAYFITICTNDRQNYFGEIVRGKMLYNSAGKIVYDDLISLETHYNYIKIDYFVVMPNHIHFILFIEPDAGKDVSEKHLYDSYGITIDKNYYSKISPQKGTIGNIIKLFKGYVTKKINRLEKQLYFAWQANYYDRIIRNEDELNRIQKYISENPGKWEQDKDNPENILM